MKKLEEIRKRKDKAELIRITKEESKETELSDGLSDAVRDGWKASTGQKVALAFESIDAIGLFEDVQRSIAQLQGRHCCGYRTRRFFSYAETREMQNLSEMLKFGCASLKLQKIWN